MTESYTKSKKTSEDLKRKLNSSTWNCTISEKEWN